MPYLPPAARLVLDGGDWPRSAGDLNYEFTKLIDEYLKEKGLSYGTINSAIGALECAKLELYRRIAAPYEDRKILENGDVYDPSMAPPVPGAVQAKPF